jgi:hypothetical protein
MNFALHYAEFYVKPLARPKNYSFRFATRTAQRLLAPNQVECSDA